MNILKNSSTIAFVLVLIGACTAIPAFAQHHSAAHDTPTHVQHKPLHFASADLDTAYSHYMHLADALVSSDFQEAKQASTSLAHSLQNVSAGAQAGTEAAAVAQAGTLQDQRHSFAALSEAMAALVKEADLREGTLYLAYCPMANGNQGAFWLSNDKEIRNPYFGEKMLNCGSIKETIN